MPNPSVFITPKLKKRLSMVTNEPMNPIRINAPQPIWDSSVEWDDEDQLFRHRPRSLQYRRKKYQKAFPSQTIDVEESMPYSVVSAVVSAPIIKLPSDHHQSGSLDFLIGTKRKESNDSTDFQGQTLLHLAAILGHEEILRILVGEISHINDLVNGRGQTPLLSAIEAGSTSTATFLLSQDPTSLTCRDRNGSSVFHYAAEFCNDIVLIRAISLLKRLNSGTARFIALQRLLERNHDGKTPFVIAIEKGSLKCIKHILNSRWIDRNVDIEDFINADSLRTTIDQDQLKIANFFVADTRRFAAIIGIEINVSGRIYNVLEYSIALKKVEFVRVFISVRIPTHERELYCAYKQFLNHYNVAFTGSTYDQTPIQRMLTMTEMVPLVPLLLEQFIDEHGVDLSIVDDCLRASPAANRCIYGRSKRFSSSNWLKQHPLSLIATANHAPVYDHDIVRICVDLKFQLFGSFLYLFILFTQLFFVGLYTGIALASPTPSQSYYDIGNITCAELCENLQNNPINPLRSNRILHFLRLCLLLFSILALLKEILQVLFQRAKYLRDIFMNILEVETYICAIMFAVDLDSCTRQTGLRCKWQWESGALGIASVWTLLLSVFMNSLKIGKYGLLFVNVFLTFMKFCLIYVLIWIGYIIAFHMLFIHKDAQFTSLFYAIPKTLSMFTGEYDFDDLFFPSGSFLQGSESAMVLYSMFIFTMNIVVMNIMVGLAVSDVKAFRVNAKREHLRSRIEKSLVLQAKFGLLCELCSRISLRLVRRTSLPWFQWYKSTNYELWKLELRHHRVDLSSTLTISDHPQSSNRSSKYHSNRDEIHCETGYYRDHIDRSGHLLFEENDQIRLIRKTDELRDSFDKANARVYHELRRLIISFQSEFDEIKRKILET